MKAVYQGRNSLGKVAGSIVTRAISLSRRLRARLSFGKIEFSPLSLWAKPFTGAETDRSGGTKKHGGCVNLSEC